MQCTGARNHWDAVHAELITLCAEKIKAGGGCGSPCAKVLARQDYLHSLKLSNDLLWKPCHSLWPLHQTVCFLHRLCAL